MSGRSSQRGIVVREFCEAHQDMADLTLARMIYGKNKALFNNIESIRQLVRYHRGVRGGRKREISKNPIPTTSERWNTTRFQYRAPKTYAEPIQDFVINGSQRVLRLSDIHYPFHDERALDAAINHGIKHDPTIILLAGDVMDCHDLSDHERDPRKRYSEIELAMVGEQIGQFKQAFPKARIIWMEGNHEMRLNRYLGRKAQELYGLPGLDVPGLVTMANSPQTMMGVEWIANKRTIRTGNLAHWHGHERKFGGKYPASRLLEMAGENIMCGHFHRTDEYTKRALNGKVRAAFSTGALCDLSPNWMPYNDWNHGFAFIEVDADGDFTAVNHRIIDGKVR